MITIQTIPSGALEYELLRRALVKTDHSVDLATIALENLLQKRRRQRDELERQGRALDSQPRTPAY